MTLPKRERWPKGKRAPREAPPPSRQVRSATGKVWTLIGGTIRDANGRKLYRLRSECGILGAQLWTVDQLDESCEWLTGLSADTGTV